MQHRFIQWRYDVNILLVDDEEELVSTLAERLGFRGIDARWATSAEQAMALLDAHRFDIAVLDVKMPRVSGLELMERIRAVRPNMKFIFLTGHGSEADFQKGCSCGACFYLIKPVRIEDLISKINETAGQLSTPKDA